ncbi:hypothetical protein BC834DRAFT_1043660 [Gloeopeniophorella convolvens]|nr:hypothetical protein BC834DRAFT_1043660 [Gloeopeniophorella convolvens]
MAEPSRPEPSPRQAIRKHPKNFSCFRDYLDHVRREVWLTECAQPENQPVHELSREHLRYFNPRPRLLQYGIPITADHLVTYADKKKLWPMRKLSKGDRRLFAFRNCIRHLSKRVDWLLEMRSVYTVEHEMVIALYTNYELKQMVQEDEDDVLKIISEELGVSATPMWYYDAIDYDDNYLRLHDPPKLPEEMDTEASGKKLASPSDSPTSSEGQGLH